MDPNVQILMILLGVAAVTAIIAAVARSQRVRRYGLLGAFRRRFSGGSSRSRYDS